MPPEDPEHLTQAAARGDRRAVDALLGLYLPQLRAFVRLRAGPAVRERESHSDIVQSVCREILQHAARFRHPGEAAFRRWLFTTALRKIANRAEAWRAEKRDGGGPLVDGVERAAADELLLDCYRRFSSPSAAAIVREEVARVEAAFDRLTEEQREVVTLAHLAGLSRAEIAEQLGTTEGAVRATLHRALVRLSALLAE